MQQFIEKRDSLRLEVGCEVECRPMNSNELYKASCISLSGSGVSLLTAHDFPENEELEISISQQSDVEQPGKFYIQIVHKSLQDDGLKKYGAMILFDKFSDTHDKD